MNKHMYVTVTATIFLAVAVLHLMRIFAGWGVSMGGWIVPQWMSWVGLAVAGFLAYTGFCGLKCGNGKNCCQSKNGESVEPQN